MLYVIIALSIAGKGWCRDSDLDSVKTYIFAGYKAILYNIPNSYNDSQYVWKIFICDKTILTSRVTSPWLIFHFYPEFYGRVESHNYFRPIYDINGDGKGEIILENKCQDRGCLPSTYVYTLDTNSTEILALNGGDTGPIWLLDLDNDTYPELIFNDAKNYRQYLAWKWDGSKYKLANFKLRNGLMKYFYHTDSISMANLIMDQRNNPIRMKDFSPEKISDHEKDVMYLMMLLIYTGDSQGAERLLDSFWMEGDNTKAEFDKAVWNWVKSSHWWKELQGSSW